MLSTKPPSSSSQAQAAPARRPGRRLVSVGATVLLGGLLLSPPAGAKNPAQEHFETALRLVQEGLISKAIREYEQAYAINPFPGIKYHIAFQHKRIANYAECLIYVDDYLRLDPKGARVDEARALRTFCQNALDAGRAAASRPGAMGPGAVSAPPLGQRQPALPSIVAGTPGAGGGRVTLPIDDGPAPTPPPPAVPGSPPSPPAAEPIPPASAQPAEPRERSGDAAASAGSPRPKSPSPGRFRLVRGPGLWAGLSVAGGFLLSGTAVGIWALVLRGQLNSLTYAGPVPMDPQVIAAQGRVFVANVASDALFGAAALTLSISLISSLRYQRESPRASGITLAKF